jgi:uncharacterized protein
MITELRVSNFYSIGEEVKISFVSGKKKPDEGYYNYRTGKNLSLINGFFGANASGKTNVLRAVVALIAMIHAPTSNNVYNPNQNIFGVLPNFKSQFKDKAVTLGATFLFGDNLYKYNLEIKNINQISREKLEVKTNQSEKGAKYSLVFDRGENSLSTFGKAYVEVKNVLNLITLKPDHTFLSLIQNTGFDIKALLPIINDFKNTKYLLNAGQAEHIPTIVNIINTGLNLKLNPAYVNDNALELTTQALQLFDSSISKIEIDESANFPQVLVSHLDFSNKVDILSESRGTQELFVYIYSIIDVLRNGGVVIYDEINRFFHPDIQTSIYKLFTNELYNKHNAQLFFSSHDHEVMGRLELDQIHIVEKEKQGTVVNKISDFEVDSRTNIEKKYRLGAFGGTPDISDFEFNLNEII